MFSLGATLRLDTFLLADHAVAAADGKLYVNGGGITALKVPEIPFAVPLLSIVLRFQVWPADVGEHSLLVRLENPQHVQLLPPHPAKIEVAPPTGQKDEETFLQIVLSFGGLPIMSAGTYKLTVKLDDKIVREANLPVAS